jgi:transcriptional regulator with GAF, ATPase, and Fis domain
MQRGGQSGHRVKGRRATRPKTRKAATARRSSANLQKQLDQRTRERDEALDHQTATSDVLGIIAKSPQSVQPVFDAIVANAARLCDAEFSAIARFDGEMLHLAAVNKMSPEETAAYHTVFPRQPNRTFIMGRAFVDAKPVHVIDIEADPDYDPHTLSVLKAAAPYRTYLGVPILRNGVPIGTIGCGRREVRPFTDTQIALVKHFASQANIAIENSRLLNELHQRTNDLSEALEQQTATSEVLQVISSSPGDLEPVFEAMLANATRLCNAEFGTLNLYEGDVFRIVAVHNVPPAFAQSRLGELVRPHPSGGHAQVLRTKDVVQIEDIRKGQAYLDRDPAVVAFPSLGALAQSFSCQC